MIYSRYVQVIAILAGVLTIALGDAWLAFSPSQIVSALQDVQQSDAPGAVS